MDKIILAIDKIRMLQENERTRTKLIDEGRFYSNHPSDTKNYAYKEYNNTISNNYPIMPDADKLRIMLVETVTSDTPGQKMCSLHESGALKRISYMLNSEYDTPQNCRWHIYNVGKHTETVLDYTPNNRITRLAAVFHDIGKVKARTTDENGVDHFKGHPAISVKITEEVMTELGFSSQEINNVLLLVKYHDERIQPDHRLMCKFIEEHQDIPINLMSNLIDLQEADVRGHNPKTIGDVDGRYKEIRRIFSDIVNGPCCIDDVSLTETDIQKTQKDYKGDTVILYGEGITIARKRLFSYVLEHPEENDKDVLGIWLRRNLKSIKSMSIDILKGDKKKEERKAYKLRRKLNNIEQVLREYNIEELKGYITVNIDAPELKEVCRLVEERHNYLDKLQEMHSQETPRLTDDELKELHNQGT